MNVSISAVDQRAQYLTDMSGQELDRIDRCIVQKNMEEAVKELLFVLQDPSTIDNPEIIYQQLFTLFPYIEGKSFDILIDRLQLFLNQTSHLIEQQCRLAICMGEKYAEQNRFKDGMDSFSKAVKIAEKQKNLAIANEAHSKCSELFLKCIKATFLSVDLFKEKLDIARRTDNHEEFGKLLDRIKRLRKFCYCDEGKKYIEQLYQNARDVLSEKGAPGAFHFFLTEIKKERDALNPPFEIYSTEKYWQALKRFREIFEVFSINDDLRTFQQQTATRIRSLFQLFLNDAITVLGDVPCRFDIRAIGSIGRQEGLPYSDLEFFILIQDEEYLDYFKTLLKMIEIQILSLGETAGKQMVFTCLGTKNKSGFHLDSGANPLQNSDLIGVPEKLASLQNLILNKREDPAAALQHQILKSDSLIENVDLQLFEEYKKHLNKILEAENGKKRRERGLELFRTRLGDFRKVWASERFISPVNIKNQFTQFIHFLLSDMALYWGLKETNTLDIIDAFAARGIFTKQTQDILKDAVTYIYQLRVRLHQYYEEQKEEAYIADMQGCNLKIEEIEILEKAYWIILSPFYQYCLPEIIEGGKPSEQVFYQLDLTSTAINIVCKAEKVSHFFIPLIKFVARYQQPFAMHMEYFKRLSLHLNLENLRRIYFQEIEKGLAPDEKVIFLNYPNRAGFRLSFLKNEQELKDKLREISTIHFHTKKHIPQIKMTSSAGVRFLMPEVVVAILDEEGNIKNSYPRSAHHVTEAYGLHFKGIPTHPLMEYAIHNLLYRLAGKLTSESELVRFEADGGDHVFPVLISRTVEGTTLKNIILNEIDIHDSQWARWTWMLISCILTRPGDGRLSNYLLDEQMNIFCIDNDISFVEPVFKKGRSQINFCSALFCLFNDKSLDQEVLKQFCLLDADAILTSWIDDVINKEQEYLKLFSEQERKKIYEEDENNRFKATILFREGALATLNMQFVYLQNQISSSLNKKVDVKPIDLLSHLIILRDSPSMDNAPGLRISKAYSQSNHLDIEERLKKITSRLDGKTLTSMQSDQACLGKLPSFEEIEKRKQFSPLKAKEELIVSLLYNSTDFLSIGVLKGKETIRASFKKIGEEDTPDCDRQSVVLSSLTSLIQQKNNEFVSVTLQHCAVLNSENLTPFLHENIEYLDIRFCPLIKNSDIHLIQRKCPRLKELYLSGCHGLTEISLYENKWGKSPAIIFSNLKILFVDRCQNLGIVRLRSPCLISFIANDSPKLQNIEIFSLAITEIRLQNCLKLLPKEIEEQINRIEYEGYFEDIKILASNLILHEEVVVAAIKRNPEISEYINQINPRGFHEFLLNYLSQKDGLFFRYLGITMRNSQSLATSAIQHNGKVLKYIGQTLRDNTLFLVDVTAQIPYAIQFLSDELKTDRDMIFNLFVQNKKNVIEVENKTKSKYKKALIFDEIQIRENRLFFKGEEKLRDDQVFLETIIYEPQFLCYRRNELQQLRENWKFCAKALRNGMVLEHLGEIFKNDKDLISIAVSSTGSAFEFVSEELKRDKPFVLEMVKRNGLLLEFVNEDLKRDREVVLEAIKSDGRALEFAHPTFKKDRKIVLEAVKSVKCLIGNGLEFADPKFRSDKEIIKTAVMHQGCALEFASLELKDNDKIVLNAVENFGLALIFASPRLKNNTAIVLKALEENWRAIYFAGEEIRKNRVFAEKPILFEFDSE